MSDPGEVTGVDRKLMAGRQIDAHCPKETRRRFGIAMASLARELAAPNSPAVTTGRDAEPLPRHSLVAPSNATHNCEAFGRMLRARRMPNGSSRCASLR
jgi:hypothetical protein